MLFSAAPLCRGLPGPSRVGPVRAGWAQHYCFSFPSDSREELEMSRGRMEAQTCRRVKPLGEGGGREGGMEGAAELGRRELGAPGELEVLS